LPKSEAQIAVGGRVDHTGEPGKPGTVRQVDWGTLDALVHWDDSGLTDWTDLLELRPWPPPEHPALFTGDRVRGILAGYKTQTRRPVTGKALEWLSGKSPFTPEYVADPGNSFSPLGYAGHRLWVRETWAPMLDKDTLRANGPAEPTDQIRYRADGEMGAGFTWRPSLHMPRWACRLRLYVLALRIERLQAISEDDARAEGTTLRGAIDIGDFKGKTTIWFRVPTPYEGPMEIEHAFRWQFAAEWDDIYQKTYPWTSNPWVWVCQFNRSEVP
jgi:hypothetical protein